MNLNRSKYISAFALSWLLANAASAQEGSTAVNNASGGTFKNNLYYVDWSVGELTRIDTRTSDNKVFMLTQGILQPDPSGTLVISDEPVFTKDEVKILPNPVRSNLQVQIDVKQPGNLKCILFTAKGEKLAQQSYAYYGYGVQETFNMTKLAAGNYFLYVELEPLKGGIVRKGAYKIIKIN
ncbi:hypothetical protein [Flavihumibacter petaseus]|uniref:Secretion system C-terminal sorting domain-containing protein n=1 Tax=Flavihumibacter petaseus NBRC 106054 TaxID=1220578 RepID=A0A0E9N1F8_9BACT|nr:hypothetical protein [Flavihumibacter petaseus]GAO43608.1 hypothetical protein FPE01S_02_07140 [Flavihumibacter petaseus NBRC 106054]